MGKWNQHCIWKPENENALHCKRENDGEKSLKKMKNRGNRAVGKGNVFGCAKRCKRYKEKKLPSRKEKENAKK